MALLKRRFQLPILLCLLLSATAAEAASEPLTYDRISLSVFVEEDVESDLLVAVLAAKREGTDAATRATEVNGIVDRAFDKAYAKSRIEFSPR